MNRKLLFEDGSVVEVSFTVTEEGKMAKIALQKLVEFLDEELIDDPRLAFHEEELETNLDLDEEELADDEDLDLDEDWLEDEDIEDDWEDEDEEDLAEVWDSEDDLR
jgi:hypothetical protein